MIHKIFGLQKHFEEDPEQQEKYSDILEFAFGRVIPDATLAQVPSFGNQIQG